MRTALELVSITEQSAMHSVIALHARNLQIPLFKGAKQARAITQSIPCCNCVGRIPQQRTWLSRLFLAEASLSDAYRNRVLTASTAYRLTSYTFIPFRHESFAIAKLDFHSTWPRAPRWWCATMYPRLNSFTLCSQPPAGGRIQVHEDSSFTHYWA